MLISLQRQSNKGLQYCSAYAIVREREGGRSTTICGGSQRERHIYLSHGHAVEIRIIHGQNRDNGKHFVMKYEGNSYFCSFKNYFKLMTKHFVFFLHIFQGFKIFLHVRYHLYFCLLLK